MDGTWVHILGWDQDISTCCLEMLRQSYQPRSSHVECPQLEQGMARWLGQVPLFPFMNNTAIPLYIPFCSHPRWTHLTLTFIIFTMPIFNLWYFFVCTIALQCGISFCCTPWISYMYTYTTSLFQPIFTFLEIILHVLSKVLFKRKIYRIVLNEKPTCSATDKRYPQKSTRKQHMLLISN